MNLLKLFNMALAFLNFVHCHIYHTKQGLCHDLITDKEENKQSKRILGRNDRS